jgi:hypothetical protein
MKLTDAEIAYLAGIFDGEGCVGYYQRGDRYHSASLHIASTDPRITQWIMDKLGCGSVSIRPASGRCKTAYSWQLCNRAEIQQVLSMIRPWLCSKGDQVDLLFSLWEWESSQLPRKVTPKLLARRTAVAQEMKDLKSATIH